MVGESEEATFTFFKEYKQWLFFKFFKWGRMFSEKGNVTVEPRYKEPLFNEVLGVTNDFLYPSISKIYETETVGITKPRYGEQILPSPWPFVVSRFHCNWQL